ncbi:MAG TPA: serine hydrolase domain-containing protein [Bacteroidales bacterium]|nr:serine hydrolase domain-containing protein [Bacteroidales bacterium]
MNIITILLQVFFIGFSQPETLPDKPLPELSLAEINSIFDEVNSDIRNQEVILELESISKNLNGSIIFAKKDSIIFKYTGGLKSFKKGNREENLITNQSLFEIASVSKQITAAAILLLVSRDSVSLEESLTDFFPELPFSNVKVKHLLTHTSGLPEYLDFEKGLRVDTPFSNQMLIQYLIDNSSTFKVTPELKFEYVNTNYALLASIIERVTGQKFEDYIRTNILLPAEMYETYFYTELQSIPNVDLCKGHLFNKREETDNILNSVLGDKSMYSTADNLFKWYKAYYLNYEIISKRWVDKAISPQNKIKGVLPSELYGYGLRIEKNPFHRKLVYHGGLWRGFHHIMTYRPEDKIFILFLSNFRNRTHNGKTDQLLDIIDGA